MGDIARAYRSDRKPTLGQALRVMALREDIARAAAAMGERPLTVLNWARDQELRPVKQAARGPGGRPADWASITGFENPADLLVLIEIFERLGEPLSRRKLLSLVAENAGDGKSKQADRERAERLKDLYRAPPAAIRAKAEQRIAELPMDKCGLQSVLAEIARLNVSGQLRE